MTSMFFNIMGQFVADKPYLVGLAGAQNPRWALTTDDQGLGWDIKRASPKTNVIVRFWPDDGLGYLGTPEEFLARKQAEVGLFKDIWIYTTNEPGFSDEVINWHIRLIELNRSLGHPFKFVICNFSVGTPEPSDWLKPNALKLLRLLDEERQWVVLGLHEYFHGVATAGLANKAYDLNYKQWPNKLDYDYPNWLAGRFLFLILACKASGIAYPRIVLTEFGADTIPAWEWWFKPDGGWLKLVDFWRGVFPGMTPEQAYLYNMLYLARVVYPPFVEAALVFQYGRLNTRWGSYDVENYPFIHRQFREWEKTLVTLPTQAAWAQGTHKKMYNVNLRSKPSTSGEIIGKVKLDIPFTYIDAPQSADWWVIVLSTGEVGYAAKSVLTPE